MEVRLDRPQTSDDSEEPPMDSVGPADDVGGPLDRVTIPTGTDNWGV